MRTPKYIGGIHSKNLDSNSGIQQHDTEGCAYHRDVSKQHRTISQEKYHNIPSL